MNDERMARHRAMTRRRGGRSVKAIGAAVERTERWFHKWWRRDREGGPEGLDDLTRANHHVAQRLPPELARTILSLRRRLPAPAAPATRSRLTGAAAIQAARKALGIDPLPCERTSERVLERNGLTAPRVRLAPRLPRPAYPGPQARASHERHEVDRGGPVYLQGRRQRYDLWVGKEAFDGAVCLRLASSRQMNEVLWFRGEGWKDLGRPEQVPFDKARELAGGGQSARALSRLIRRCLRYGVRPVFIPAGEPPFNGRAENFNGWFPPRRFHQRFTRPGDLRRERARRQEAVHPPHVHPPLGGQTPAPQRRGLRLQQLPARFVVPTERLPLAKGRVTFLRRVRVAGTVTVLSQSYRVGKRHRGLCLRLVVDTGRGCLTAYLKGRVLKRWPCKLLND